MSEQQPDFYLSSTDTEPFLQPMSCFIQKKMKSEWGLEVFLVKLVPPFVPPPQWPAPYSELKDVIIQSRRRGTTIAPVSEWPLGVHVSRLHIEETRNSDLVRRNDVAEEF